MLAERRSRPGRAALGVWLAVIAGFVDAVGYIELHRTFVAHMTGNTNQLGQQLAKVAWTAALPLLIAVVTFVVSIALVTRLTDTADERGLRSPTAAALAIEALLLAVFMAYGSSARQHGTIPGHGVAFYLCLVSAVAAMGAQTAALTKWGERTIRTTYLSGMLTRLGQELARLPANRGTLRAGRSLAAVVYCVLFVAFLAGAVLGTWLLSRIALWSLAVPLAAVAVAAVADWLRPSS